MARPGLSVKRERRENGPAKSERLGARATPEQKAAIQRAADIAGLSITDFMISSALARAEETIRAHRVLQLTERETAAFFAAIENPPRFDEKMREAARWHLEKVEVRW